MANQHGFLRIIGIILATAAVALAIFFFTSIGSFALEGTSETRTFDNLAPFSDIEIKGSGTVLFTEGAASLSIESDTALLDKFIVTSEEGTLTIEMSELDNIRSLKLPTESTLITITAPEIESLLLSGSYELEENSRITGDELKIKLTGKTDGKLHLTTNQTSLEVSGQNNLELSGAAFDSLEVTGNGSGSINAQSLGTPKIHFKLNGSLSVRANSPQEARLELTGASKVFFESLPTKQFSVRTAGQSVVGLYDPETNSTETAEND